MPQTHAHRVARAASSGAPRAFRITREVYPVNYEQDLRDVGLVEGSDGIWFRPVDIGG